MLDVFRAEENNLISENNLSVSNNSNKNPIPIPKKKFGGKKKKSQGRDRRCIIRDAISAMCLCNNVTPVTDDNNKNKDGEKNITYQASSPDEVALVKFAVTLDMKLIRRTDKEIVIFDASKQEEKFEVLANFPFSSDTKRMGIILRNKKYGHIIFYLKGAENIMMKFVKEEFIQTISEHAENLAAKGLRTLVLSQKLISQKDFDAWNKEYEKAKTSMEDRQKKITEVVSKLEKNMDFLCVTGVEDLLQDDVASTIENMRSAGMKVWMLTGDKVETATCISISAGIKDKKQKIFTIRYDDLCDHDENDEKNEKKVEKLSKLFNEYNKKIETEPHLW